MGCRPLMSFRSCCGCLVRENSPSRASSSGGEFALPLSMYIPPRMTPQLTVLLLLALFCFADSNRQTLQRVQDVRTTEELLDAIENAEDGAAIVIRTRRLALTQTINITAPNIELRGRREGTTFECRSENASLILSSHDAQIIDLRFERCVAPIVTVESRDQRDVEVRLKRVAFRNNRSPSIEIDRPASPLVIQGCNDCPANVSVHIEEGLFENNTGSSGGAIYSTNALLDIQSSIFRRNRADSCRMCSGGGAIFSTGHRSVVHIESTNFTNNQILSVSQVNDDPLLRPGGGNLERTLFWTFLFPKIAGGAIALDTVSNVSLQNCHFTRNVAPTGGAIAIKAQRELNPDEAVSLEVLISGCTFHWNLANISRPVEGSRIDLTLYNLGGALYVVSNDDRFHLTAENSTFTENSARFGGAVHIVAATSPQATIARCGFEENDAIEAGGALLLRNVMVELEETACTDNFAVLGGCMLLTNSAQLTVKESVDVTGKIQRQPSHFMGNAAINGGALMCAACHAVTLKEPVFDNNTASGRGGAIYILQSDVLFGMEHVTFRGNQASEGGAICVQDCQDVSVRPLLMQRSSFIENKAISGGAIHSTADNQRQNRFHIANADFEANDAVVIDDFLRDPAVQRIMDRLVGVPFHAALQHASDDIHRLRLSACGEGGGGTLCLILDNIPEQAIADYTLTGVQIQGSHAVVAGGIFTLLDPAIPWNRDALDQGSCPTLGHLFAPCRQFKLQNVSITGNTAEFAPGIFTENPDAVAVYCDTRNSASLLTVMRDVIANGRASMECNVASYCVRIFDNIVTGDSIESNRDSLSTREDARNRGFDVGTHVDRLVIPGAMQEITNHSGGQRLSFQCRECPAPCIACPSEQNGILIDVLDLYGQRIRRGISDAALEVLLTSPDIQGAVRYAALNGRIHVDSTVGLGVGTSSAVRIEATETPGISTELHFTTRMCFPGERPIERTCEVCSSQQYSFEPSEGCDSCEQHAVCTGGAALIPVNGYWHSTPFSPQFHECIVKETCSYAGRIAALRAFYDDRHFVQEELERLEKHIEDGHPLQYLPGESTKTDEDPYPQCAPGYTGPLCGSCERGYGHLDGGECEECAPKGLSGLIVFLMALWTTGFVGLNILGAFSATRRQIELANSARHINTNQIRRGHQGRSRPPSEEHYHAVAEGHSITRSASSAPGGDRIQAMIKLTETIKIFVNYLQVTSAALKIPLNWPRALKALMGMGSLLIGFAMGSNFGRMDCAFGDDAGDSVPNTIKYLWLRATFPFIMLCFFFIVCAIYIIDKGKRTGAENRSPASLGTSETFAQVLFRSKSYFIVILIVVTFFSYISITSELMKTINCIHVDEESTEHKYDRYAIQTTHRVWVEDTSLYCFRDKHAATGVFGILGLAAFSFGVIAFIIVWLIRNAHRLGDPDFIAQYGFIYQGYRETWYTTFWEAIVAVRKGLIAAAIIFALPLGPNLQAVSALGVVVLAIAVHIIFLPFKTFPQDHPNVPEYSGQIFRVMQMEGVAQRWVHMNNAISLNALDGASLFMSAVVFYAGLVFNDEMATDAGREFITACVVYSNGTFFLFMVYRLYSAVCVAADFNCAYLKAVANVSVPEGTTPLSLIRKCITLFRHRSLFSMNSSQNLDSSNSGVTPEGL